MLIHDGYEITVSVAGHATLFECHKNLAKMRGWFLHKEPERTKKQLGVYNDAECAVEAMTKHIRKRAPDAIVKRMRFTSMGKSFPSMTPGI